MRIKLPRARKKFSCVYRNIKPTRWVDKSDKRYKYYVNYKKRHGFSPDETWNLDFELIEFLLPRIKYSRHHLHGYPLGLTYKRWCYILDCIIWSFEWYLDDDCFKCRFIPKEYESKKDEFRKQFEKGMKYFSKYWRNLWD